jgi:flavorubredoxin
MAESARKRTVYVIYYSMYGHIEHMARSVCKGLEKAGGKKKKHVDLRFAHPKLAFRFLANATRLF